MKTDENGSACAGMLRRDKMGQMADLAGHLALLVYLAAGVGVTVYIAAGIAAGMWR